LAGEWAIAAHVIFCGIASSSHGVAPVEALGDALSFSSWRTGRRLRTPAEIRCSEAHPSMRERTFYAIAILLPLAADVAVAVLGPGEGDLSRGLPPGATAEWLIPQSAVRQLVTHGVVALWLFRELGRRTPAEFGSLIWRAPFVNEVANILLWAPFALVQGEAREMLAGQGGRVVLRLAVRLLVGFTYIALVVFVREQLRQGGALETDE
jgi:hypothetical protein